MKRIKHIQIHKIVGYILIAAYIVAAILLLVTASGLNMLPMKIMVIIGVVLAIIAAVFALMHERFYLSIIASLLTVAMISLCILGSYYIHKTNSTITEVTTADAQTDVVGMYVMDKDKAEELADVADYKIGIAKETDRENTDKSVAFFEESLGSKLNVVECNTMFTMMNDLKEGEVKAVVINDAYTGIIADVEGFDWVATDIRKIASAEHQADVELETETPEDVPETFIMYLSGIDTYGGISARSRSDVNILAVVNTKTKNILLLSTPRDAYLSYSVTGGAKDKLTHAGIYGVDASIDALEQLYGINVDYYLRVNFSGFVDIIDALGGIEVYSDYAFTVQNIRDYQQGYNQLTGLEALAFARERYSFEEGDYQRAKNQMEVIRAVVQKSASSSMLANYNSVMNAVAGSFETSMPNDQIAALVKMQLSDMAQWNILSYTTAGTSYYAETYSMPGQELYVIDLNPEAVEEAKKLIQEIYSAGDKEKE